MRYNAHILSQQRTRLEEVIPLQTPFTLLIETSRLCNFRCRFCPQCDKAKFPLFEKNLLTLDDIKLIADQMEAFPQKFKKVYMHGTGEALLNPQLPEMIRFLKKSDVTQSIDLTSNGALLTADLGRQLVQAGLDHLHISIEALSSEKYKEIAGTDQVDFDRLVDQLRNFSEIRDNCRFTIKVAESSLENEEDRKRFFNLFGPLCDELFVENIYPIWPEFEVEESIQTQCSDNGQYGQKVEDKTVCPQIFTVLAIKCDGSVSPCSVDWRNRVAIGNIYENSLVDIWNGDELRKLRLAHLTTGRKMHDPCRHCGLPKYSCIDNLDSYKDVLLSRLANKGE